MTRPRALGTTILAALCAILTASAVEALANRVFVSARSGNDANSCDNIATPCQTFAGAVAQLNPGGEAIALDTGGYGPVTITKALTIEAAVGVTAFVHPPAGNAITILAGAGDTVILRGLVLNTGSGSGIAVNTVGTLHIENCIISGFGNLGIFGGATGSNTFIKDTIVRQNNLDGADLLAGRVSIDHCRFEGNGSGGVVVSGAEVTIRDSVSAGNGADGFFVVGPTTGTLNIYHCVATNNAADGLRASNTGAGVVTARVANSSITDNVGAGLNNAGGGGPVTFESLVNNLVRGNTPDTVPPITPVTPQ